MNVANSVRYASDNSVALMPAPALAPVASELAPSEDDTLVFLGRVFIVVLCYIFILHSLYTCCIDPAR